MFEASIKSAYTRRFKEKGAQAEGVFWSSRVSQTARFEQVLANMKAEFGSTNFCLAVTFRSRKIANCSSTNGIAPSPPFGRFSAASNAGRS